MNSIDKRILEEINRGKKWFFCDYFDTLVERDCHPEDIKGFWASEMASNLEYLFSESCILSVRISAEKSIAEKYNGLVRVSYNYNQLCKEIYNRLLYINREGLLKKYIDYNLFYEVSLRIEAEIEKKHQFLMEARIDLLKKIKKKGINIAIVSDFYIGKDGFDIYASKELMAVIDKVFISCDYGYRKDTGELYDYILWTLNVSAQDIVMLGDDRKSDKSVPEKKGIKSFLIKKNKRKQENIKIQEKRLWKLMKENKSKTYANYAFSLYFFIDGLYRYLRNKGAKTVLFCAREGEHLKELFDLYVYDKKYSPIKSEYFYVSRLASFVPSLKDLEIETFENLFRYCKAISPKSFMLNIGFKECDVMKICEENNLISDQVIIDFDKSEEFKKIKNSATFICCYKEIVSIQKTNFIRYFNSLCSPGSDVYIVDVGWRGTIQDNIYNIYDGKRKITGIYLGTTGNSLVSSNNIKIGINFTTYPYLSENFDIWSYDKSFYEKLLYASHGATVGYDSNLKPILETFKIEKETYEHARPIQRDIMSVFKKIMAIMDYSYFSVGDLRSVYTRIHLYTICHIGNKHLKIQNELIEGHLANFGELSWTQKNIMRQIGEVFQSDPGGIIKKLLKEGLDIKFMYPGIKVMQKLHINFLIPIYTRFIYIQNKEKR